MASPRHSTYGAIAQHSSATSDSTAGEDLHQPLLHSDGDLESPKRSPSDPETDDPAETMSLADKLYAYDLTLATLTFQRFGRSRAGRIAAEALCLTDDGILWLLTFPPLFGLLWIVGLLPELSDDTKAIIEVVYIFLLTDIVGIALLKQVFKRQRPPHHAADARFVGPDQHSFPSGHATRAWGFVALLVALAESHPAMLSRFFHASVGVVLSLAVVWALAISFTRVALGRHYPSDVLGGTLIGFFLFFPVAALVIQFFGVLPPTQ